MNVRPSEGLVDSAELSEIALPRVAQLRQFAYRFLAALFLPPDDQRLNDLEAAARDMLTEEDYTTLFPFSGAWEQLLYTLAGLSDHDRQEIEGEYQQLFLAVADSPVCPLHESHYRNRQGQGDGWGTGQLIQRYRAAGLALAPAIVQSPDHVAVELEFMAFLCGHEAMGWQDAATGSGNRSLKRQRVFLHQHLSEWLPELSRRIIVTRSDGFYAQVAEVAEAFIHHETDLIELILVYTDEAASTPGGSQHAS